MLSIPARAAYCDRKASVCWCRRAVCSASCSTRGCSTSSRGSTWRRVHWGRAGQGEQSRREKRTTTVSGLVASGLTSQDRLCLPTGHVAVWLMNGAQVLQGPLVGQVSDLGWQIQ